MRYTKKPEGHRSVTSAKEWNEDVVDNVETKGNPEDYIGEFDPDSWDVPPEEVVAYMEHHWISPQTYHEEMIRWETKRTVALQIGILVGAVGASVVWWILIAYVLGLI